MIRKLTKDDYYPYMRVVRSAKLKGREKALLRTYADWYYWTDQAPCIYGFDQLAAWSGMSRRTATRAHARLEELGWVITDRYGRYDPIRVWPTVGVADPEYDLERYATAHRYSDSLEEFEWAKGFRSGHQTAEEAGTIETVASSTRMSHRRVSRHRGRRKATPTFGDAAVTH
jgi:hypothetical protein